VYSAVHDIESLVALSRDLVEAEELETVRLQAWHAERCAIFTRLKSRNLALIGDDSLAVETLMCELLEMDGKICVRVIENQKRLAEQIAAARKIRQTLVRGSSHAPRLLQRLA
jgi:hypothetical protein